MKVIAGLGNTGEEYIRTRHNVGFMTADYCANALNIQFKNDKKMYAEVARSLTTTLIKPTTFMNDSGKSLRAYYDYYGSGFTNSQGKELWVIHDDLDIELGKYKIQFGTGPKGHNGLLSIYEHLGTQDFWHVRVGIENRGQTRAQWVGRDYVLLPFTSEEIFTLSPVMGELVKRLI